MCVPGDRARVGCPRAGAAPLRRRLRPRGARASVRHFRPGDGLHGYFGWYEPALAVVSLVALLVFRPAWLRTRLPIGETVRQVSTTALFVLLAQESLERSLQAGHPVFAALTPSHWLVLLVGVAATAFVLACALRAGHAIVSLFVAAGSPRTRAHAGWSVVTVSVARRVRSPSGSRCERPRLLAR